MSVALAILLSLATSDQAQDLSSLRTDQAAIVYDQCLARAAVRASRTDATDTAIYDLAKQECAPTRQALLGGHMADVQRHKVLDAIDADKQASFPELTKRVRERRRAFEAQSGSPR